MRSDTPPYLRIVDALKRRIASGELAPGAKVPSTRQLAAHHGVALATATRALTTLAREGLVVAMPRVGNVVAAPPTDLGATAAPEASAPIATAATTGGPTRDRIVRAAIAIADREGLEAVSMRGVAAALGVATMGLYRHVHDKDALVELMTDAAFGESTLPTPAPAGWRARLELVARAQWALYRRHPWLAETIHLLRPLPLPNLLGHADWVLASIDGLGLDAPTMLHLHVILFSYVRGIAVNLEPEARARAATGLDDSQWMQAQEARFSDIADARQLTTFGRVLRDLAATPGYDFDLEQVFEFGLGPLLDGFERLIAARGKRRRAQR